MKRNRDEDDEVDQRTVKKRKIDKNSPIIVIDSDEEEVEGEGEEEDIIDDRTSKNTQNSQVPIPTEKKRRGLTLKSLSNEKKKAYRNRSNGSEAMHEITIYVDKEISERKEGATEIMRRLKEEFHDNVIKDAENPIISTIYFARKLPKDYAEYSQQNSSDSSCEEEDGEENEIIPYHDKIILRIPAKIFINFVREKTLETFLNEVERLTEEHKTWILLIIEGVNKFIDTEEKARHNKLLEELIKKKRKISEPRELAVTKAVASETIMKISDGRKRIKVYETNDFKDTAQAIVKMCKKIALSFYENPSKYNLFVDFKKKTLTGKKGKSPEDCWFNFLRQIPGISEKQAKAITNAYKKPKLLLQKYRSDRYSETEKENRLQNLTYRNKKVGPAASKKVYRFFTERDGSKRW